MVTKLSRRDVLKLGGLGILGGVASFLLPNKPPPPKRKKKMIVNYDSGTTPSYQVNSAGYGFEFIPISPTIEAGGIIVGVAIFEAGESVISITYKSRNLIPIPGATAINGLYRSELWYLPLRFQVDGDEIVDIVFSTAVDSAAAVAIYSYFGGIGASGAATGTGTPASKAITTLHPNSIVFSNLCSEMTGAGITDGSGQDSRWGSNGPLGWLMGADKGPIATPASTTLTFEGMDPTDLWAQSSIELLSYQSNPPAIMGM